MIILTLSASDLLDGGYIQRTKLVCLTIWLYIIYINFLLYLFPLTFCSIIPPPPTPHPRTDYWIAVCVLQNTF